MSLWSSITGAWEAELTSAELEMALIAINASGVELRNLSVLDELTARFQVARKDAKRLQVLTKKRGEKLRFLKKRGLFWFAAAGIRRPFLLTGLLCLAFASLYLPSRIFFVRVTGNDFVPTRQILACAEDNGVCFGASRRRVRSEKVKNGILSDLPQLQWAGVNTAGCVATISVRERAEEPQKMTEHVVTSIVAARDGYILSGTATQGNVLFRVGESVKAGQTLISGYTDCGICIQATRSEGEIIAQTERDLTALTPEQCLVPGEPVAEKKDYSVIIGKKRINLWKGSGNLPPTCGRMYEEYYVTLPGGFQLPVAVCVDRYRIERMEHAAVSADEAEGTLQRFSQRYLLQEMVAGEIRGAKHTVTKEKQAYQLQGAYICVEMIGRERREQIGDWNG